MCWTQVINLKLEVRLHPRALQTCEHKYDPELILQFLSESHYTKWIRNQVHFTDTLTTLQVCLIFKSLPCSWCLFIVLYYCFTTFIFIKKECDALYINECIMESGSVYLRWVLPYFHGEIWIFFVHDLFSGEGSSADCVRKSNCPQNSSLTIWILMPQLGFRMSTAACFVLFFSLYILVEIKWSFRLYLCSQINAYCKSCVQYLSWSCWLLFREIRDEQNLRRNLNKTNI